MNIKRHLVALVIGYFVVGFFLGFLVGNRRKRWIFDKWIIEWNERVMSLQRKEILVLSAMQLLHPYQMKIDGGVFIYIPSNMAVSVTNQIDGVAH